LVRGGAGQPAAAERLLADGAGLTFYVAQTADQVIDAWHLLYHAYLQAGFIKPSPARIHTVPQAIGRHTAVVLGSISGVTVSTISAIGDSSLGLPLDKEYPDELAELRANGRKLVEIGLFGDRRDITADGDRNFNAIFELMRYAVYFGYHSGATDMICGIPPRRARLYARAFGFQMIGQEKSYDAVEGNPVVLLRAEVQAVKRDHAAHKAVDYWVKNPLPPDVYEQRFDFDPRKIRDTALDRYLTEHGLPMPGGESTTG
jgi:hypothetical protein